MIAAATRWLDAARAVLVVAFVATVPAILGTTHANRVVWTVIIAALPLVWTTLGFHAWRRVCPLAAFGQLGRLLGRPGTRRMGAWMSRYYLLVQLAIMIGCLSLRLIATNGGAAWLAGFLVAIAVCAALTSLTYAGKTWCNFLCPIGVVERMHTEPALGALASPEVGSRCAPCVACKKHCPDIDLAQAYEHEPSQGPRRVAYYAWPGVVVGFYVYFYLVAGSWSYYFSGAWAYERALDPLSPGLCFAPAIPRALAAPATLIVAGAVSFVVFASIERGARAWLARGTRGVARAARVQHVVLALAGMTAFDAFYAFAGQPTLRLLPGWVVAAWSALVGLASLVVFGQRVVWAGARGLASRRVQLHHEARTRIRVLDPDPTAHRLDL